MLRGADGVGPRAVWRERRKGLRPQSHCLTLGLARAHSSVRRNARTCHRHRSSLTRRWLDGALLGTRSTPRARLDSPSRHSTPGGGLGRARCRPRYPPRCRHTSLDRRGGGAAADRPAAASDLTCGGPPGRPRRSVDRSNGCDTRPTSRDGALAPRGLHRAHHHVVHAVPAYPLGADGHVHCPTAARSAKVLAKGVAACGRGARSMAAPFARFGRWIGARAVRVLYAINVAIARARAEQALGIDDAIGVEDPPAMHAGECSVSCTIEVFQNPYLPRGADNRRCHRRSECRRARGRGTRRRTRTGRSHPGRLLGVNGEALAEDPQRSDGHRGGDRRTARRHLVRDRARQPRRRGRVPDPWRSRTQDTRDDDRSAPGASPPLARGRNGHGPLAGRGAASCSPSGRARSRTRSC